MENKKNNKSSDTLYLEKLEFDPELNKSFLNFFVRNFRVVLLMIMIILILGIYSFVKLPRESNPEVKIPFAIITTVYQGASPEDVEELITKKIEKEIVSLSDVKQITSNSSNSISNINVEFEANSDSDDVIRKLRDKVTAIKDELPDDSEDSVVNEVSYDDRPILSIALTGPYDGFTLKKYAEEIKDKLETISTVREVNVIGGDEREFEIAYDPNKLVYYKISPLQVHQIVQSSNVVFPSGTIKSDDYIYNVRLDNRFFDIKILQKIPILHDKDGGILTLSDIAKVEEKAIEKTHYSRLSINGSIPKDSVSIDVIKKTGGSVIDISIEVKKIIEEMIKKTAPGVNYAVTTDMSERIKTDFDRLSHDFLLTIILVGGILFLIVGAKEAFVAGLAIPLVFFATFGVMLSVGISLNFLSLFSLILSLGLLVDDAIVVVSATKQYMKTGKFTPEEAILLVLNDFKVVLTTTTLTTVWAFLPLLMASGMIGEFIKSIPITVSVTVMSSLFIALMINHPLSAVLERIRVTKKIFFIIIACLLFFTFFELTRGTIFGYVFGMLSIGVVITGLLFYKNKYKEIFEENKSLMRAEALDPELIKKKLNSQGHGIIHFDVFLPIYEKFLRIVLKDKFSRRKMLITVFLLFIIAIALPATGIVKSVFFPESNRDTIFINLEADDGLRLEQTDKLISEVERQLLTYKEIKSFSTIVGSAGLSAHAVNGDQSNSSNLAGILVNLVPTNEREIKSYDLAKKIREDLKFITNAKIDVASEQGGPPSGSAFELRIIGDDLEKLKTIANDLKKIVNTIPGIINPDISIKQSPPQYTFKVDNEKLELYGIDSSTIGFLLRTALFGTDVTKIIRDGKEIKVVARFDKEVVPTIEDLKKIQIVNNQGQAVLLSDVASVQLDQSIDTITRIDQKRVILFSANIEEGQNANDIIAEFQKKVDLEYQMPDGYSTVFGGENEQNAESVQSILKAMVLAGMLIVCTLVVQFNSFRKAIIVLATIPLALIGVFFGMAITGITLSFPGLIGILALFGIVVKNAIILMDKINLNLKSGILFNEAIIDACKSRLEAIFITSICTIFGIIPITLSNETWTALGGAIIFGLMVSSFLTLFVIPTLFMTVIDEEEVF